MYDADVPLEAQDDGGVDGGHHGRLDHREDVGKDDGEGGGSEVRPQVRQRIHQGAPGHHQKVRRGEELRCRKVIILSTYMYVSFPSLVGS